MKKQPGLRGLILFLSIAFAIAFALPYIVAAATLVNDTYADGNSQNQDLPNNSIRLFNGRAASSTVRTDAVGSVDFNLISASNSDGFWGFFTNSGSPVNLNVGDTLTVTTSFTLTGFSAGGQDIRFGVLNSNGTRNANNLTGGMNDASFVGDTGYAMDFFPSGSGSPFVLYRRTNLTGGNVFNTFADFAAITPGTGATTRQTLQNSIPYTLSYSIQRLSNTDTKITASVTGGTLSNLNFTATESSATPNTAFDYFGFRVANNTFATHIKFTNWLIDYAPSPPVITSQPQPTSRTVQVGSNVTMSVGASGNALTYQWQKDLVALDNVANPSAATPTLNLTNVQLVDQGSYRAVVTNAGGSVPSNAVTLNVSVDPVPPAPAISQPPVDTTVIVGQPTSLSVTATGDNLFYQWFKNNVIIPSATSSTLGFGSAQVSDTASYTVVISNSSGSITSPPAKLLVVSAMTTTAFSPTNESTDICIDSPLKVTFNQAALVGNTGRIVVHQDDGTVVDTIDLSLATQSRINGTVSFNYFPVIITGNTAAIYLHQKLSYDHTYYLTMEPGVVTDASGAPFSGISSTTAWQFTTRTSGPTPGTNALTVAADGTGDFCTVQGAIDFVPPSNPSRVVITVKKGTYTEIVYVGSNKPFITVQGEDRDLSVIQYSNNNNFNPTSTTTRAMFGVDASDFSLERISLTNTTPKGGSQAEAFRGNNLRIELNQVNLRSFQDTLLLQSTGTNNSGGYVKDSYIEGDVDFTWGTGSVFFENCELKMLTSGGFYTQIRNPSGKNGNIYHNCKLTGAAGVTGGFLGRIDPTVFPFSEVIYINTAMGPVIPVGWQLNNATTAPNVKDCEYNSTDLNGVTLDVSQRAPFSCQLSPAEAAQFSDPSFVLGGWVPPTKLTAAVTLGNLTQTFTGAPITPSITTSPAGLSVDVTYNGSSTPPTALGSYTVVATINDATYQGTVTGTLVINPVNALITFSNLYQVADGNPKPVTVNTNPAGTAINVTYNGSSTPPSAAGQYSVIATVSDPNFQGAASATLTIYTPGNVPQRAFPGAEGSGAYTPGGRGGDVYHVTNLNDSGPGSLRDGVVTATGPRTIVFDLSGTIFLQSKLSLDKPFMTLAGQTAPGDGITVAGWTTVVNTTHDIIVRYMRFRPGDINCPNYQDDGFTVDKSTNIIADHVSASWSVDETLSVTESDKVSIQWSFITESMRNSCHVKGTHGYGSLIRYGNGLITYHHNLYAHHDSRNPRLGDNIGLDFVNNIIYDWGIEAGYSGDATEGTPRLNSVGNYLVAGPSTPASKRQRNFDGGSTSTQIYEANNLIDSNVNGAHDGTNTDWGMFIGAYTKQQPARFQFPQVDTDDAATSYERVLTQSGMSLSRDSVDNRIVSEVRNEGGHFINSQNDVGGWPTLNSTAGPVDTDGDGIPDAWEIQHGLNPNDPNDGKTIGADGYSNLETYLNTIVGPASFSANNAAVVKPASGTTSMLFTVTLASPVASATTVQYSTAVDSGGAHPAIANVDFDTTSGTVNFAAGDLVKTVAIPVHANPLASTNQTFLLVLSSPSQGSIASGTATGTILLSATPSIALISELRSSGPAGPGDDFVEIYNNTDSKLSVPASGWSVVKSGTTCVDTPQIIGVIPGGTMIPARGHYLLKGSQYSLGSPNGYPAGSALADGDLPLSADIENDANIGLFATSNLAALSSANRLDAVGFGSNTGSNCDLLRKGTVAQPALGSTSQYSFIRKLVTGQSQDTSDNASDFMVLSTTPLTAVGANATPTLGAPGPENLQSPLPMVLMPGIIDPAMMATVAPNRVRSTAPYTDTWSNTSPGVVPGPYTLGTLAVRRSYTNNTGQPITRLRFRLIDVTTAPAPNGGTADLRGITAQPTQQITVTGGSQVTVIGAALEGVSIPSPSQPQGGGINSTLTLPPGQSLAPGQTVNIEFLLGVKQGGSFRFFVLVEGSAGSPP